MWCSVEPSVFYMIVVDIALIVECSREELIAVGLDSSVLWNSRW